MRVTRKQLLRMIKEAAPAGGVPDIMGAIGGGRRQVGPTVPDDMINRIKSLRRGDLQDHLYDIVDAIESGADDYTLDMLKLNLEDAERLDEGFRNLRSKIRHMLKEAMDVVNIETGELIDFGEDSMSGIPDAALPDLVKRLGLNMSPSGALSNADFEKLEAETIGKQDRRAAKRKSAQMAADRERLNIDNLLTRLQDWAVTAADEYQADNPDMNIQDVAYDLADAWEFSFAKDEQEELLWHFDGDLNDLKIYAAESM